MKTRVARWAPILVVPTLVLGLAGCSGDDEPGDAGSSSATDTPSATDSTSKPPTTSPVDLPVPPEINQSEGAVDDVDYDPASCKTSAGKQTVTGTVTNPTDKPTGYRIVISWTGPGSDTLGLGYALVRGAKPGVETDWKLSAKVPEGASQCVLNVLRGVIPK